MPHPLVEDGGQKGAPLLWFHRALGDLVALLKSNLSLLIDALDNRDELDELGAHLVTQEAVHLQWVIGIRSVDRRQNVELYFMLLQQPRSTHHFLERRRTTFIYTVGIVHGLWTIQAQPDQEVMFVEKSAPIIIQEDAIGLHGVLNVDARASIGMHKLHRAIEKVESHQSWFATLPGYRDFRSTLRFEQLTNIGFEGLVTHAKTTVRVEFLLGEEKAIGAIEVTGSARRLTQDMKVRGSVLRPASWKTWHRLWYC